jgi:hypothetical protein
MRPFRSSHVRILILACVAGASLVAADTPVLAHWQQGAGTIAASAARAGQPIVAAQRFAAPARTPARVTIDHAPGSVLTLSPGASAALISEPDDGGGQRLVVLVESGAVQADIADKGGYASIHMRGAAMEVRVTGTIFVVERVRRDADYVALVQGRLKVSLRKDVAEALGKQREVELDARQGVGASTGGGLDDPDKLNNRPQIGGSPRNTLKDQGTQPPVGDGGWGVDGAGDLLADLLGDGGPVGDPLLVEAGDIIGDLIIEDLATGVGDQVLDTAFSLSPLGPPPGTP